MSPMARVISLTVLTVIIVFLGITFFQLVAPFLLPLFLAGVAAILCHPIFRYFIRRTNNRVRLAAGLTTASVMLVLLVPLVVGTLIASLELYTLAVGRLSDTNWKSAGTQLQSEVLERIRPYLPPDTQAEDVRRTIQQVLKSLAGRSLGLAGTTLNKTLEVLGALLSLLIGLLMFAIALYYFLADGPTLLAASENLIPVHVEYQRQLRQRFEEVVRAVVMATFFAAIAQGLATSIALYLVGLRVDSELLQHVFIIGLVATLFALIPLSGTWLVWGPCAAWCLLNGYWGTAVVLTLFGSVVIGTMDNVIRTYVLQSDARLHPLLAFISVLGGLRLMGLGGVFVGPIVASCLHALVKIYNAELKELSKQKFAPLQEEQKKKAASQPGQEGIEPAAGPPATEASESTRDEEQLEARPKETKQNAQADGPDGDGSQKQ